MVLEDELGLVLVLGATWLGERAAGRLQVSPLLGQIVAGIVVGPSLLELAPEVDALKLMGLVGVFLLVVEAGISVDVEGVKRVGVRALAAAAAGVVGPVLLSLLVMCALWGESASVGLAVGASIAPTSLGFSAKLLAETGSVESAASQLVFAAAVADDVMALVMSAEIEALDEEGDTWALVSPLLGSLAALVLGVAFALLLPTPLARVLKGDSTNTLLAIFSLAVFLAWVSALLRSSPLLGCFCAGLVGSRLPGAREAWAPQMKRYVRWGTSLFFAATVGFEVPRLNDLMDPAALLLGVALALAAVVGKFAVMLFAVAPEKPAEARRERLAFGFAMQGRGEFSFLIAKTAFENATLDTTTFAGVIWALLIASFVSPFGFRHYSPSSTAAPDPGAGETVVPMEGVALELSALPRTQ